MTNEAASTETAVAQAPEQVTKKASKKTSKAAAPKKAAKPTSKKESKPASKPSAKKDAKPGVGIPREFNKKAIVLDLLRRKDGATMAEIAKATDWQNHSIRGFISGALSKKMGLTVESSKNEKGERTYKIASK